MAIKRQIVIEVDDKGAIKAVDGLTDAIEDNTAATKKATDANEEFEASIQKQQAQIKVLDGAVNLVGGSIETLAGGLVLSGALSDEQAEKFEGLAIGALAFADGTKRTIDGIVNLREGLKVLTKGQKLATLATKAFGVAQKIALGPVGLILGAITLLGGILFALKDKVAVVTKAFDFFGKLINKVAVAIGLGKTEAEKFAEAQGQLADRAEYTLQILQAEGASTEELIKKERELLTLRLEAAKNNEERTAAAKELAIFEARQRGEAAKQAEADAKAAADALNTAREKRLADAKARREAERKARQDIADDAELIGLDEFEKERKLAERERDARIKEVGNNAEALANIERLYQEELKQIAYDAGAEQRDLDAKAKEDEEARLQELFDLTQEYSQRELEAQNQTELELLALEEYNALQELERLEATEAQKQDVIDFYANRKVEANKRADEEVLKNEQAINDARLSAQLALAQGIGGAVGQIAGLFEEGTAAAKAAALAEIAINTGIGFVQGLDIAQKGAAATGPAAPFAFPIFYATQVAAVLASVNQAKNILQSVPGGGSGGGTPTPPSVRNPSYNGSTSSSIGPGPQLGSTPSTTGQPAIKTYVLAGDVTSGQQADNRLNQRRTL